MSPIALLVPCLFLLQEAHRSSRPAAESRPATRDAGTEGAIERERALNRQAYEHAYLPNQSAIQSAHKGKWTAVAGGQLIPPLDDIGSNKGKLEDWHPYAEPAAADREARLRFPAALHRFVFRIGDEGDVEVGLGGCERAQVLGLEFFCAAAPEIEGMLFKPRDLFKITSKGREITLGVHTSDDRRRPYVVRPTLSAPAGGTPLEELFACSSASTSSVLLRKPVADAMRLELWEIPGGASVSGVWWPKTSCRRASVRVLLRAEGFELDRVYVAEIWPDDRDDLKLELEPVGRDR